MGCRGRGIQPTRAWISFITVSIDELNVVDGHQQGRGRLTCVRESERDVGMAGALLLGCRTVPA